MSQSRFKWSRSNSARNSSLRRKIFATRAAIFRAAHPILCTVAVIGLSGHTAMAGLVTSATLRMAAYPTPSVLTALPFGAVQTAALAADTARFSSNATRLVTIPDTAPIGVIVSRMLSIAAAAGLPAPRDALGFAGDTGSGYAVPAALGRPDRRHVGSVAMLAGFGLLCLGGFLVQWRAADRVERRQLNEAYGPHDDALLFRHSGFGRWWRSARTYRPERAGPSVPARALGASWGGMTASFKLFGHGRVVRRDRRSATLRSR
jgi:hypothetical protein